MAYPNFGQGAAASSTADLKVRRAPSRIGTNTPGLVTGTHVNGPNLLGGGKMAVGPLHTARGLPTNPVAGRQALLASLRGGR